MKTIKRVMKISTLFALIAIVALPLLHAIIHVWLSRHGLAEQTDNGWRLIATNYQLVVYVLPPFAIGIIYTLLITFGLLPVFVRCFQNLDMRLTLALYNNEIEDLNRQLAAKSTTASQSDLDAASEAAKRESAKYADAALRYNRLLEDAKKLQAREHLLKEKVLELMRSQEQTQQVVDVQADDDNADDQHDDADDRDDDELSSDIESETVEAVADQATGLGDELEAAEHVVEFVEMLADDSGFAPPARVTHTETENADAMSDMQARKLARLRVAFAKDDGDGDGDEQESV